MYDNMLIYQQGAKSVPVLLLCYGDEGAKHLLRNAIEARYGINPPAIEQLAIHFEGRAFVRLGPFQSWVPFRSDARFKFPDHLRWDFTMTPLKLPVRSGAEIYDGEQFYSTRNYKPSVPVDEEDLLDTTRRRLWTIAAMLLTPLSEIYIKLTQIDDYSFIAENTVLRDSVTITVNKAGKLVSSAVDCINPDTGKQQRYKMTFSEEQSPVNELMLPNNIYISWDDDVTTELNPTRVDTNPTFNTATFQPK
jgi:hypothetical protein